MSDNATSHFVKMGSMPLTDALVNISGQRSPYTISVPRKGPSSDSESEPATHRGVGQMASGEHPGPAFRPLATIDYPNAPEHSDTGRGMRIVPSKAGVSDFWNDRASQSGEVIR